MAGLNSSGAQEESPGWMRDFEAYAAAMASEPPDFDSAASVRSSTDQRLLPRLAVVDLIVALERMRDWARSESLRVMKFVERVPKKSDLERTDFLSGAKKHARQPDFFFGKNHKRVY